jgi:hypothetical protein
MAKLYASRGAQPVMNSEFIFNFNDTITDVNGVVKDFGTTIASAPVAYVISLPPGAQIIGGDLIVETAGVGPTAYTVALGVLGNAACYLAASSLLAAANTRYALLTTGLLASNGGLNILMTMVDSVAAASAGKFRVSIQWKMDGRQTEATPS